MSEDNISVIDAAHKLDMRKATLYKWIKKLKINTIKQKNSDHRGQAISYISESDYLRLAKYQSERATTVNKFSTSTPQPIDQGVFYLIQTEPDLEPGRFKLGFTTNLAERLSKHKCSAPYATIVAHWACKKLWEQTAIDSVTQGCERIREEVFRTDDLSSVLEKCKLFFSMMPTLDSIEMSGSQGTDLKDQVD